MSEQQDVSLTPSHNELLLTQALPATNAGTKNFAAFTAEYDVHIPLDLGAKDPYAGAREIWLMASKEITKSLKMKETIFTSLAVISAVSLGGVAISEFFISDKLAAMAPGFVIAFFYSAALTSTASELFEDLQLQQRSDIMLQTHPLSPEGEDTYLAPEPDAPPNKAVYKRAMKLLKKMSA